MELLVFFGKGETMKQTIGFVSDMAKILKIDMPKVEYDTRHFETDTMLAQAYIGKHGETIIYLKQTDSITLDTYFSIAHEMRHIWQVKYDYELYMRHYKGRDKLSLEDYNNQLAEVDANAFATVVMEDLFDVSPLYKGMSEKTIELIEARADYIVDNEIF